MSTFFFPRKSESRTFLPLPWWLGSSKSGATSPTLTAMTASSSDGILAHPAGGSTRVQWRALHAVARDTPPPAPRHHERFSLVGLELPCELEGGARCGEAGLGRHSHAPLAAAKRDLVRNLRPRGQRIVGAAPVAPAHRVGDLQVDRVEATGPGAAEASVLVPDRVRD